MRQIRKLRLQTTSVLYKRKRIRVELVNEVNATRKKINEIVEAINSLSGRKK